MRLGAEGLDHLSRRPSGRIVCSILLVLVFCTTSIRAQSSGVVDGSQDSSTSAPETSPVQLNTTSSSSNDSAAVSSTPPSSSTSASQSTSSSPLPDGSSPNRTDDPIQLGSSPDNPPDLPGTQTTATALVPAITSSSGSLATSSQPASPPNQSSPDSGGLSGGAVAGIVFVSIVGGVALFAGMIVYFRRLERSIAQDKREIREKQARRYNQLDQNRHTSYIPGNQPQPYEL